MSRPISDRSITVICYSIGATSLLLNLFCLWLIWKIKMTCTRSVFVVLILLQVTYAIQNVHFAVLYIPFIYIEVAGGYCIGLLCEPHYVSFSTNLIVFLFLTGTLGGLFTLLLFLRHQSLVGDNSRVRLETRKKTVVAAIVMSSNILLPVRYSIVHFTASDSDRNETMLRINQSSEWVEQDRNYGVIPMDDAPIDGLFVSLVSTLVSAFTLACTIHIFRIIYAHNKLRSSMHLKRTIRQTRQSLIQMATFCSFLTAPVALLTSLLVFEFDDDSVVLLPCIFLFSLNSLAHSTLIMLHSPTIQDRFKIRLSITVARRSVISSTEIVYGCPGTTGSYFAVEHIEYDVDHNRLTRISSSAKFFPIFKSQPTRGRLFLKKHNQRNLSKHSRKMLYIFQNFHLTILFVPFFYIRLGGGYCIGLLCEPHYVSFSAHLIAHLYLSANLCALFVVLLFLRHQTLVNSTSPVKFGNGIVGGVITVVMVGCNALPVRYTFGHFYTTPEARNRTMQQYGQNLDWIETHRNFGVISMEDAAIDKCIVGVGCPFITSFMVACSVHIVQRIYAHNKLRSNVKMALILRQTRQSMIQIATFGAFISAPVVLFMSLLFYEFEDDSVVLIPCILLFSLNSLSHSTLTIIHSPSIKSLFRQIRYRGESITPAHMYKSDSP